MCTVRVIFLGAGVAFFLRGNCHPVSGSPLTAFHQLSRAPRLVRLLPSLDFRDRLSLKKTTELAMWAEPERSRVR